MLVESNRTPSVLRLPNISRFWIEKLSWDMRNSWRCQDEASAHKRNMKCWSFLINRQKRGKERKKKGEVHFSIPYLRTPTWWPMTSNFWLSDQLLKSFQLNRNVLTTNTTFGVGLSSVYRVILLFAINMLTLPCC